MPARYTFHIGPGMTLDGGRFGGSTVLEVTDDTVVFDVDDEGDPIGRPRAKFVDDIVELMGEREFSFAPVSKGTGVFSATLDFSGCAFYVPWSSGWEQKRFDADTAANTRDATMQRDFDRGRVSVRGY